MAENETNTIYYPSRPILRVDGDRMWKLGQRLLKSLLVEETTLGLFRCEATFFNWGAKGNEVGFLLFDRQLLDFGKILSVEFGPAGHSGPVFTGRITGLEARYPPARPPEFLVLAEDRFQDLRMERRTRTFENVTDTDVIGYIAGQHGLSCHVDVDGPTYRVLAQVNQSDLALLRERVAAIDAELWIDKRTLYAQARSRRDAGSVSFTYGQKLLEFSALADLAHQRTLVRVSGWDVANKETIAREVGESAIQAELNGGRSGSSVLAQALGERHERVVSAVPLTDEEAQKMAEARYRERARGFVRGIGVVDGSTQVRVGATVELSGLGPLFDGPYYVTLARHTFTHECGYRTTFEAERPAIGG
jgi:phage protein D